MNLASVSGRLAFVLACAVFAGACGPPDEQTDDSSRQTPAAESRPAGDTPSQAKAPRFNETPQNLARVEHMTLWTTLYVLYHETGHFLTREYDPQPAPRTKDEAFRQAQADEFHADRFATWAMTPAPRPSGLPPETFDPAVEPDMPGIIWPVMFWRWLAYRSGAPIDPSDTHLPNEERAYDILCLLLGTDPGRFEHLATQALPASRRAACPGMAADNRRKWEALLAPQIMRPNELDRYLPAVTYEDAPPALARGRAFAMQHRLLERVAAVIGRLRTRPGLVDPWVPGSDPILVKRQMDRQRQQASIRVVGGACQLPDGSFAFNAFYFAEQRAVLLCYSLVSDLEQWSRDIVSQTRVGQGRSTRP